MRAKIVRAIRAGFVLAMLCWLASGVAGAQGRGRLYWVTVDHGLSVPAADRVRRALSEAEAAGATALVVEVRGGGSLGAAWPLARELYAASVPVVVWVGPRGAHGGPVGTLLLAAADIAAMAPQATVGFAAPLVDVPAGFSEATQQLVVDDAATQTAVWARERGRSDQWLEQAVRSGAIVDAEQAIELDPPVIDLVATAEELPAALQGRQVATDGESVTLETLGAQVMPVTPTFWESLWAISGYPDRLLFTVCFRQHRHHARADEPGHECSGRHRCDHDRRSAGRLLAWRCAAASGGGAGRRYAADRVESVVTTHGGLAIAGTVLLILGALYLVDTSRSPGMGVSFVVMGGVALALGAAVLGLLALATRVRGQRPVTGHHALLGRLAEVRQPIAPEGMVFVDGALWSAWTDQGQIGPGELVEVAGVDGLRLYVKRVEE